MPLSYENLDDKTRQFMLQEIDLDMSQGILYISPRLNKQGVQNYPSLLKEAAKSHNDAWLANELRRRGYIKKSERRRKPTGGFTTAKVPSNAPETLAEGEFNRFYTKGLCRRAIEEGIDEVQVYRGKTVRRSRSRSKAMIGKLISAEALLKDIRQSPGVEPALGLPPGPNSGLTIRLPHKQ